MRRTASQDVQEHCGRHHRESPYEDDEGTLATRFMDHVYDIRYLVDREKRYLGCELLVAGGGPTIWVNTWSKEVEGYWGGDRVTWAFQDNIGLDDYNEEMYNCI